MTSPTVTGRRRVGVDRFDTQHAQQDIIRIGHEQTIDTTGAHQFDGFRKIFGLTKPKLGRGS